MSFTAMAWASKQKTGSSTRKLILLLLADRANDDGYCYPSLTTIADDCELKDVSSVKRNIKVLEGQGLVRVQRRKKEGINLPNVYHLIGVGAQSPDGRGSDQGGVGAQSPTNLSVEPITEPTIGVEHKCPTATNPKIKKPKQTQLVMLKGKEVEIGVAAAALSDYLVKCITEKLGRKPVCKKQSNVVAFKKLLKARTAKEIAEAIAFVTDADYANGEYAVVAQSGRAIYDKWDKIENAMRKSAPKKETVQLKGDKIYFINQPKTGGKYHRTKFLPKHREKYLIIEEG